MKPVKFDQCKGTLTGGPADQLHSDEAEGDLAVYRNYYEIIACSRPNLRERLSILFRRRFWLRVSSATTHPPVCLEGSPPFD